MKSSMKKKLGLFVLILLVIIIVLYFLLKPQNNQVEINNINVHGEEDVAYDSIGAKDNQVLNFLAYPNQQKFCPNIFNSRSSFWVKLPDKYGKGKLAKFCCTSCYYHISEEIYCGQNKNGKYKICILSEKDINNLKKYYELSKNLDFDFPQKRLEELKGTFVLKMKINNKFMPIQIIKTPEQLKEHEKKPTIAEELYRDNYECGE